MDGAQTLTQPSPKRRGLSHPLPLGEGRGEGTSATYRARRAQLETYFDRTAVEAWIDRSEVVVRYIEVQLAADAGRRVLLPMNFIRIDHKTKRIICRYIRAAQFALTPATKHPDQITLLEEDKITAFFAAGSLFAWPGRGEPVL